MDERLLAQILIGAGICSDEESVAAWAKAKERLSAQAAGNERNTIRLYGPIMPQSEFSARLDSEFDIQTASAASVQRVLSEADGGDLTVRINSIGGLYPESTAISALLLAYKEKHSAQLTMIGDGQVMSAAAFIFLRGDHRYMDELAMAMLHEVRSYRAKEETMAELSARLDELKMWNEQATAYAAKRLGMKADDYNEKVADGKNWHMSAQAAVEAGFATGIKEAVAEQPPETEAKAVAKAPDYGPTAHLQFAVAQKASLRASLSL